jgi:hypothetical protein
MPARLRHRIESVRIEAVERAAAQVDGEVLIALSAAVQANEVLRFDYEPAHRVSTAHIGESTVPAGESTARVGESSGAGRESTTAEAGLPRARVSTVPVGQLTGPPLDHTSPGPASPSRHLGGRWYLVAWDLDRGDWRTFRADRITPRTPTGPRFTPRELPGGDVAAFVTSRFRGGSGDWPCLGEVILALPAAAIAPYLHDGVVEELGPNRSRLVLGSWSWPGLAATIGRFDADIELVGPAELRAAFARLTKRYTNAAEAHSPAV